MAIDHTILTLLLLTPLTGAILLALVPEREGSRIHAIGALFVTLLTFLFTLHLPFHYNYAAPSGSFQFEVNVPWVHLNSASAIRYHLGVDGLSLWLVVLTGLLAPLGVLASWRAITTRTRLFYSLFLLQQVAMLGIFFSLDLFLYYSFWELSLVPMALLIAVFGRTFQRRRAAVKFFLYAFIPSAVMLVAVLWLYTRTGTFDLPSLALLAQTHGISPNHHALWLASLAFLLAFAVKVPIFPLHGWLADAVSEAPTAAVMILAGKLGLYSILRFSFSIFPDESRHIAPLLIALGAIGIVYGSLLALLQKDLKRLAAFSTLGHVSFIALGIFTFTIAGLERYGTYNMRDLGGLAQRLPWMVTLFVITALAAVGLPMLSGFVGEFLILTGAMQSVIAHHVLWTAIATTGVILSAAYMLSATQRVFYGSLGQKVENAPSFDLNAREHLALWPLAILFLIMGVASPKWMRAIDTAGSSLADKLPHSEPSPIKPFETEAQSPATAVDCQTQLCSISIADLPSKEAKR